MPFSAQEYEIVNFVEQTYLLNRHVPSAEVVAEKLGFSKALVKGFMANDSFRKACEARGIRISGLAGSTPNGVLTEQQLAVANTLLDFADNRSQKKKLADLGVSSQTYQGWLRDPGYQAYVTQRAENLLPDITSEAHLALVDNVRRGDIQSIKLYYEMTGRWSSKTVGELNVEFLLMKILEVIQKHVTDPATLEAIGGELSMLAPVAPGAQRPALENGFDV